MNLRTIYTAVLALLILLTNTHYIKAVNKINCQNRYLILVNPVRGRDLWTDKSLNPLRDQYGLISKSGFVATWLLTYDSLNDSELIHELKNFNSKQESGLFLEITRKLSNDTGVYQDLYSKWSSPNIIFLSGYSRSERKVLIDGAFSEYKQTFGKYPESVGAWWIDSFSLSYLKTKYKIKSVLIVADQKVTDDYGIWGQWWSYPYYPSDSNILVPASDKRNNNNVVVVQWAQRDPVLAYGGKGTFSLFSMQANDYTRVGKDINYFMKLADVYLDCANDLGQITVGLETGMESIEAFPEYVRQIEYLSQINNLKGVTMSQFSKIFRELYKSNPEKVVIGKKGEEWVLTKDYRKNEKLGDYVDYQNKSVFSDFFIKDKSKFLDRDLSKHKNMPLNNYDRIITLTVILTLLFVVSIVYRNSKLLFLSILFIFSSYGLIFRSGYMLGWDVYYGPVYKNLLLTKTLIIILVSLGFYCLDKLLIKYKAKDRHLLIFLFSIIFSFDWLVSILRYTYLNGAHFFGIIVKTTQFAGIWLQKPFSVRFSYQKFPTIQARAFIKFNFEDVWNNTFYSLVVYPLFHIVLACFLWFFLKRVDRKIRVFLIMILLMFYLLFVLSIINADPRHVVLYE